MKFHIANMTCGGCARGITSAIKGIDPDATLNIDLQNRIVEINTTVSEEQVISTLSESGFTAEPV